MRPVTRLLLVAALLVSACGPGVEDDASGPGVYAAVCARCHADNLLGGFGPPLVGPDSPSLERPREFLVQTVERGLGRMPGFAGSLSEDQIDRVVDFILEQQGR